MKFAIVGDGAMGTACAVLLARKPSHTVTILCQFKGNATTLAAERENVRYLPGVRLPDSIDVSAEFADVANADAFVVAVPTIYLAKTLDRWKSVWPVSPPVVSVIKGLEQETFRSPSRIITDVLGDRPIAALSGPSHAEEIALGMPASVVAASNDPKLAKAVQQWFSSDRFRVYTTPDMLGTELAGALKNVIAIAAGICDGLQLGDNAKSALITRGLVEMTRFGVAMGAQPETFQGLAGLGDLITTCISRHGRNRRVGEMLGAGETLEVIKKNMKQVAEGVWTAKSVYDLAQNRGIVLPVAVEVYRILYEGKSPLKALDDLMARDPRSEVEG